MKFVIAGASGFLGTAWSEHLQGQGHEVTRLVRHPAGPGESGWDPYAGTLDLNLVNQADVVANLAGASLVHFPWTKAYQQTFRASRLATTSTLAKAVAYTDRKPALIAQNGIAGYGDCGDTIVTESSPADADTFLGALTVEWAEATAPARIAGARVVVLRTAVVLDKRSGALKAMKVPFQAGLGGRISHGRQYFATISLQDWLRAATYLALSTSAEGAYNLSGPTTTTNAEFTKALARHLHRPALLRVPAWPIRKLAGPLAPELLSSIRLEPQRLHDEGFTFDHATLEQRLSAGLA